MWRHEASKLVNLAKKHELQINRNVDIFVHNRYTNFSFISTGKSAKRTPVGDLTLFLLLRANLSESKGFALNLSCFSEKVTESSPETLRPSVRQPNFFWRPQKHRQMEKVSMGNLDVNVQTNTPFGIQNIPNPIQVRVRGKSPTCIETTTDVVDRTTRDEIEPVAAIRG